MSDNTKCELPGFLQQMYGIKEYGDAATPSEVSSIIGGLQAKTDIFRTPSDMGNIVQQFMGAAERILENPVLNTSTQTVVTK